MSCVSGSIQLGSIRVHVLRGPDVYGDETNCIEYRVVAPILPHWGNLPHEGAEWVVQHGIGPRSVAELEAAFAGYDHALICYRGSAHGYPYYRHPIQQPANGPVE